MQHSIIGKIIDNYEITGILGKGGMGIVYKAKDMTLDRDVALKMMDANVARDEEFLKRFKSEAKALAKLQNANIVSVFALRETELGFCLVMEYVEGGTLSDRIRAGGAMLASKAIPIFKQITTALDHAHQVGVIHRDIKPSNVMLSANDFVKITDFGLAKIQQVSNVTVTMGTGGTLYYMSPEQVKGLANVDARGDIYSIGMTLYETLAGRVPFGNDATDFDVRQSIVEGKIPPLERFSPSVPRELAEVVLRSTHRDPSKRYQTCAEMCNALSGIKIPLDGNGEHIKSPARKPLKYKTTPSARRPLYVTLLIGSLLVASFFALRPFFASPDSFLSVDSIPAGAQVSVNGKPLGKTPVTASIEPGDTRVRLEKTGYLPKDTLLVLRKGETLPVSFSLLKLPADKPIARLDSATSTNNFSEVSNLRIATDQQKPATAKLLLRAVPSGSFSIDGGAMSTRAEGTVDVSAGVRKVIFRHPQYGSRQFSVNLRSNESKKLTCYFEAKANVTVSGGALWAYIVRNGVITDESTPKVLMLPPGKHRISVSKMGYDVAEGERVVVVEPSHEQQEFQLAFTLKKK
jgi:serine/threonine protein kinase